MRIPLDRQSEIPIYKQIKISAAGILSGSWQRHSLTGQPSACPRFGEPYLMEMPMLS
jgi:hypothetical protein